MQTMRVTANPARAPARLNRTSITKLLAASALAAHALLAHAAAARAQEPQEQPPPQSARSAPKLVIEVFPGTVDLPPGGGKAQALIIMRNPSPDVTAHSIRLTPFTTANIKSDIRPTEVQNVRPNSELAWTVDVWNEDKDPTSGTLYLRADYLLQIKGQPEDVPRVSTASLAVTTQEIKDIAEVKVETTLQTLEWQRPGKIHLIVNNKSNQTLSVRDVIAEGPSFIEFDKGQFAKQGGQWSLPPHQTGTISIDVRAKERVQPGKHLLVFTIPVTWENKRGGQGAAQPGGGEQTRNIVVSEEVTVGVLGEATILALLAVPSFLVLPGVLILAAWGMLWKMGFLRPRSENREFPLEFGREPTNFRFWVAAITISIGVIFGYMWVYSDFLGTYGLRDIVLIWLLSVLLLGAGGYVAVTYLARWLKARRTPSPRDKPIPVLRKLHRQGLGVLLNRARVPVKPKPGGAPETETAFIIQPPSEGEETVWVAPLFTILWKAGADAKLKEPVEDERRPTGDARALARALDEALSRGAAASVEWNLDGAIKKPTEVKIAELEKADLPPNYIFEEKVEGD